MRKPSPPTPLSPAIVLVAPQLGENIGTAARAMANFGLSDLRLVNPREGWPNKKAHAAASGADGVIEKIRTFVSTAEAIADLGFVYATTARAREVAKPVVGPREAAANIRALAGEGTRTGVMFGPERTGLTNEDLSLADEILTFPVDPGFPSINLAQAVLLFAYEWRLAGFVSGERALSLADARPTPAPKVELIRLFEHLESALADADFFRPPEKRPHMVEALRSMLQRAGFSEQEVRTLRGVVTALEKRPTRPRVLPDGTVTTTRGKAKE
jgi:tRNA/rRNA methyltransferase